MTMIDDGQAQGIIGGKADLAAAATGGSTAAPVGFGTVTTPTFVTATALQLSTTRAVDLYINITTAAALTIAIGPTSSASTVLNASESDALGLIHVSVPLGWYVKLTGTMANLAITAIAR